MDKTYTGYDGRKLQSYTTTHGLIQHKQNEVQAQTLNCD
jgi:hypothetical protein